METKCTRCLATSVCIVEIDSPSCKSFLLAVEKLLPTTHVETTAAAPTHQGEICPNAKFECQLSKGNICNGDRSDCSSAP